MRNFATIILIIFSVNVFGQDLAECGIDNNRKLTQAESEFLNKYMNDEQRNGVNFTNKRVIFITGPGASRFGTKTEYFDNIKKWKETNERISTWTVELNEKEKIASGGYDVIVTYWVKVLTKRRQRIIIGELKSSR